MKTSNALKALPKGCSLTLLFYALLLGVSCDNKSQSGEAEVTTGEERPGPIFEKVLPEHSGILFENNIQEDVSTLENLFDYDYFYNGAGTGVADLNNDGLLDIFFCGNQVDNKLFINKGDLKFEDVTAASGINSGKHWSNGVTFVDINSDGWLDIYISQGGPNPRLNRKNLLLLNQKDGTFEEVAEAYGLADMGISTQSAFFDYDRDGDLDCIVMNESEYYGADPILLKRLIEENPEAPFFNSSHLYRNDGDSFTEVSKEAGIQRPIFGLGLSIADINTDGLLDIYMASDYYLPDALFINQGDGTFKDQIAAYTQQISYYGMGMDIADIDNDALQDIFVLDMASSDHYRSKTLMASMDVARFDYLTRKEGFHYQYMYNSLQLNMGQDHFSNIAQQTGIASTDWSWSVLMHDFDLDADKDIFITNGYRKYALDNDLQQRVFQARRQYKNKVPLEIKEELYKSMPSEKLSNLLYVNQGHLDFKEDGKAWGLGDLTFSNGAAMGDLDNDGDIDLVVNNMDENAFLYRNRSVETQRGNYLNISASGATSEDFPEVTLYHGDTRQMIEVRRVRGYRSAHATVAHFGLGQADKADSLKVRWLDGSSVTMRDVQANQTLEVNRSAAQPGRLSTGETTLFEASDPGSMGITAVHQENPFNDFESEILLPYKQSQFGPYFSSGDVNGDGLTDVFMSGASGQAGALLIKKQNGFQTVNVAAFEKDKVYEDMESIFFDIDSDGDLDLYVVSGGNEFEQGSSLYQDRVYLNDGAGNFTRSTSSLKNNGNYSGKAIVSFDFDQDGDSDLVIGNRILAGNYPRHAPSALLENREGILYDITGDKAPGLQDFGIINDLLITDFDGDGLEDLMAVGEWTGIGFFKNVQGTFQLQDAEALGVPMKGWWFSVHETDVNADGRTDYILGNAGQNIKFSASPEKPFKVYATDFDDNGTPDIVLSKKYEGKYVPVRGRECSSQQMPFIAQKFPSYSEFASASLEEVYGESLKESYEREINTFTSFLILNNGDGSFTPSPLPAEAQMNPIFDLISEDLNGDGREDLILAGNIYETEVETPRLDAISGTVLLSASEATYHVMPHVRSGLYLKGNLKSLLSFTDQGNQWILGGRNDARPLLYRFKGVKTTSASNLSK